MNAKPSFFIRPGYPEFTDLPWDRPLPDWGQCTPRVEEVARGLSRHPFVFVNYDGRLYGVKELPAGLAKKEFELLCQMENLRLPAVTPVGYALGGRQQYITARSYLFTRFLDQSLPYRSLFMHTDLNRYSVHLLDAMAGLLVQLHLAGVFWGDCSLSNTLFRRDAGHLQAYLVDAETAEIYPPRLSPTLRHHDLQIMEEEVNGDLEDLIASGLLARSRQGYGIGASIRQRYNRLWEEITRDLIISNEERFRLQERVRVLNELGFTVGEIEAQPTPNGDKFRLRVMVTDRNFHRNRLFSLTGLTTEEMQARQMVNEIVELQAVLSRDKQRSTPLSVAAYHWMEYYYRPVIRQLEPLIASREQPAQADPAELYCQVLEHKWYLSERAHRDVGHQAAVADFLRRFGSQENLTTL